MHAEKLSKLLRVSLASRDAGEYRYCLKLMMARVGFYLEGKLEVQKLTSPTWIRTFDVKAGSFKPGFKATHKVFEVETKTGQEWLPDDFEGWLFLGDVGLKGLKFQGGLLFSDATGRDLAIEINTKLRFA